MENSNRSSCSKLRPFPVFPQLRCLGVPALGEIPSSYFTPRHHLWKKTIIKIMTLLTKISPSFSALWGIIIRYGDFWLQSWKMKGSNGPATLSYPMGESPALHMGFYPIPSPLSFLLQCISHSWLFDNSVGCLVTAVLSNCLGSDAPTGLSSLGHQE